MNNESRKIKIVWVDTKVFSPERRDISLSKMETTGVLEKEHVDYLIIRDPITVNFSTKENHPKNNPTFYMIPRCMIESINFI